MLLERDQLRHHMHVHDASASASVVSERDHLAALMAELKQSVLVCNASGIVLLYNEQAAEQLKNSIDDTRSRVPLGIAVQCVSCLTLAWLLIPYKAILLVLVATRWWSGTLASLVATLMPLIHIAILTSLYACYGRSQRSLTANCCPEARAQ